MRQLKFRAWDFGLKKFHYPKLWDNSMPSNWENYYILQQFTGLHDKNGKEIYEGDIVRMYSAFLINVTGITEFKNAKFVVREDDICFEFKMTAYREVVGNIYEPQEPPENL